MKRLVLLVFIFLSFTAYSQSKFVGLQAGMNISNISKQRFDNLTRAKTGVNVGLSYENFFRNNFSFGVDLLFTQKGFDQPIIYTDVNAEPTGEEGPTISDRYNYVALPIKVGWRYGDKIYGFTNIGVAPAVITNAQRVIPAYSLGSINFDQEEASLTDFVRRYDVGGLVELGAGYEVSEKCRFFGMLAFQHSFTPFNTRFLFPSANLWHYAYSFTIGAKYQLPGKKTETILSQN